jgi:hypothetical protein
VLLFLDLEEGQVVLEGAVFLAVVEAVGEEEVGKK